jgi:hypothetical protein
MKGINEIKILNILIFWKDLHVFLITLNRKIKTIFTKCLPPFLCTDENNNDNCLTESYTRQLSTYTNFRVILQKSPEIYVI